MSFWEIVIPSLILVLPLLGMGALIPWSDEIGSLEHRLSYILFSGVAISSLLGFFQFKSPVILGLETGLPLSSREFELALMLDPSRMGWIFFSSIVLLGLTFFDGHKIYHGAGKRLRFIFLAGTAFFSALAFLSERIALSVMFIEITVFLLHGFSIRSGAEEGKLDRVSYFKRGSFVFLGLAAMLVLNALDEFNAESIVLLGIVLYMMSLVFSKHNFLDWQYLPLSLIQSGAAFFLIGRFMAPEMAPDLWLPLAVLFAISVSVFSAMSLLSMGALNSHFWLSSALVGYLLFTRFNSAEPFVGNWGIFEIVGLMCAFALSVLSRSGPYIGGWVYRTLTTVFGLILLSILCGFFPGIELPGGDAAGGVWRLALHGILTFLVATAVIKTVVFSFKEEPSQPPNVRKILLAWAPSTLVVVLYLVLGAGHEINFLEFLREREINYFSQPAWAFSSAAMALGLATGIFLGTNMRFILWSKNRQKRMEDFVPRVDPLVIGWNRAVVAFPELAMGVLLKHCGEAFMAVAAYFSRFDRDAIGKIPFSGVANYSTSVSMLVRIFHSGNLRFYIYFGIIVSLLAAGIFLGSAS